MLVQVSLRTEVPRTPSSAWSGLELMTSRSIFHVTEMPAVTTRPSVTSILYNQIVFSQMSFNDSLRSSSLMDGDILAIKSSGIFELSPNLGLLPERAWYGVFVTAL